MFNKSAHKGLKRIIKGLISYIGILLLLGMWGCSKPIIKEHTEYIPVPAITDTLIVHDTTKIEGYKVIKGDTVIAVQYRDRKIYIKVKPDTLRFRDIDTLTQTVTIKTTDWGKTLSYSAVATVALLIIFLFLLWRLKH